jgi:phage tail sheath gpL-like
MSIPTTLRVPFTYVEFDSSRAFVGPSILAYRALIVGAMLAAGTKTADEIVRITSAGQAATFWGAGSNMHRMAIAWFANNKTTEVYGQGVTEATGAQGAVDLVITGNATADGTFYLYVVGKLIQVAVSSGDTPTVVSGAIETAVNADTTLPVTCDGSSVGGTATFTAKNTGLTGNDIDIRINMNDGEELPAGESVTVGGSGHQGFLTGGSGAVDLTSAIAAWSDEWYNVIVSEVNDATNIALVEAELTDRFGPIRMIDGVYFTGYRGNLSGLSSYGNARNSPHVVVMENGGAAGIGSPSTTMEKAASTAGRVAASAENDPAQPFQTLELVGIIPPAVSERFTLTERNTLLFDGIATSVVSGGRVRIERAITTYQTNAQSAADVAYLDSNTLFILMYLRYDFRTQIQTRYPRAKLADDGVQVAPGQSVMTPKVGRAEAVAIFRAWENLGLVENVEQFKTDLVVERNQSDPNRMDWILPPDLINQLRVNGATIQFLLQSPSL